MQKELKILIVDDHPLLIDAYINLISCTVDKYKIYFLKGTNAKDAYNIIKLNHIEKINIDLAIFDISIPEYKEENIFDGTDLAIEFKNKFIDSKVIIISMHDEGCLLSKIFNKIQPDGFLNKSDINFDTFSTTISKILENEVIISNTIIKALKKFNELKYKFDDIDYEIIKLLEKDIKTKDIPPIIGLTLSAIEKRKKNIKFHLLNGEKGNDVDIVKKAKTLKVI